MNGRPKLRRPAFSGAFLCAALAALLLTAPLVSADARGAGLSKTEVVRAMGRESAAMKAGAGERIRACMAGGGWPPRNAALRGERWTC
jgi:hypothetical protein